MIEFRLSKGFFGCYIYRESDDKIEKAYQLNTDTYTEREDRFIPSYAALLLMGYDNFQYMSGD